MKSKNIVFGFVGVLIGLTFLWMLLKWLVSSGKIEQSVFWEKFQFWSVIIVLSILAVIGIGFIVYKLYFEKQSREKDSPKDYVDTEIALKIWEKKFTEEELSYWVDYSDSKEGKLTTFKENALEILDTEGFPHSDTGNPLFKIEFRCLEGKYTGLNICFIKLWEGKEWIKNNYRWRIRPNTSTATYKHNERDFPLDTPQSEESRFAIKKIELMDEGWTRREIKDVEGAYITQPTTHEQHLDPELQVAMAEAKRVETINKMGKK